MMFMFSVEELNFKFAFIKSLYPACKDFFRFLRKVIKLTPLILSFDTLDKVGVSTRIFSCIALFCDSLSKRREFRLILFDCFYCARIRPSSLKRLIGINYKKHRLDKRCHFCAAQRTALFLTLVLYRCIENRCNAPLYCDVIPRNQECMPVVRQSCRRRKVESRTCLQIVHVNRTWNAGAHTRLARLARG